MVTVKLPSSFLLSEGHTEKTISILTEFVKYKNEKIGIDFSELKEMTKGDLVVLLAQLEKSILTNKNKILKEGSWPKKKSIKKMLQSVDDVFHVNNTSDSKISNSEKEKLIDPDLIDEIVGDLKKIGIKNYFSPFNVFLTELIGNAVEHGILNRKINWWLTHEVIRKENTIRYTFVDMGNGIINSHKRAKLPFKYYFLRDEKVVLDALSGDLGSSTKEPNRGRGLPQLFNMIEKEYVSNVVLITNKVSLCFEDGKFYCTRNKDFKGTYFCWTINKANYNKWKNLK